MMATKRNKSKAKETDTAFILKLVLYLIIGSQWLFIGHANANKISLPLGVIIGAAFAMHDSFKIDRKIEYAMLLVAMLIGYFAQIGLYFAM